MDHSKTGKFINYYWNELAPKARKSKLSDDEEEAENGLMVKKQPSNLPKCPVCNSTNIEKISVGKKIKGSMLFGLFSNDAKKQMRCKDCGYKF